MMSNQGISWDTQPAPPPSHAPSHPQSRHHGHAPPQPPRHVSYGGNGPAPWTSQQHVPAPASMDWSVDAQGRSYPEDTRPMSKHSIAFNPRGRGDHHAAPLQSQESTATPVTQEPYSPGSLHHPAQSPFYSSPQAVYSRRGSRPQDQFAQSPPQVEHVHHQRNSHIHSHTSPNSPHQPNYPAQNGFRSPPPNRFDPRTRPNRKSIENSIMPAVSRQWGGAPAEGVIESSTVAASATPCKHATGGGHWDDALDTPRQGDGVATTESSPWNPDRTVAKWAQKVEPESPPVLSSARETPPSFSPRQPAHDAKASTFEQPSVPERPSSAVPEIPAATVYVSDDESASAPSTKLPTPTATPRLATIGIDRVQAQVRAAIGEDVPRPPRNHAPPVLEVGVVSEVGTVPYQAPIEDDVNSSNSGRRRRDRREPIRPFFKQPVSAIYSPQWADRRLLVELPVRMKCEIVLRAFQDNFSRYGHVKYVFHHEKNGDSCEKGFVVFADVESLRRCLDDPGSRDLTISSPYTRQIDTFSVVLKHLPPEAMTKAVFIQVIGARHNDTPAIQTARGEVLPEKVTVVTVLRTNRHTGQKRTFARVLDQGQTIEDLTKTLNLGKRDIRFLDEIHLGLDVAEKDFIPRLCDYFGEICWSPIPPSTKEQGWIVIMGGPQDAMRVMDELGRIPGLLSRWAQPGEGACSALSEVQYDIQESPLGQLERHMGQPIQRNPYTGYVPPQVPFKHSSNPISSTPVVQRQHGFAHQPPPLLPPVSIGPAPNHPELATSDHGSHHSSEGYRHLLHHALVPTYKGRVLDRVEIDGEVRFIDRAAVFVGRLSKVNENRQTLFDRFTKYGPIFEVEYNHNQRFAETTYAIARVLFHSEDAASKAIKYENGAISFGSGIKVEERRVLPSDVETKEMYFDHLNRPIDPYNKGQYSPNSHLRTAYPYTTTLVHPPQFDAGGGQGNYPSGPPFGPIPPVAFGYGPPPAFWQMGPNGVQLGPDEGSMLPPTPPQQMDGQLPGVYPGGPGHGDLIPMIQCMGQNFYPYPIPNGVYTPDMFFTGPMAPPVMPSPPHSPSVAKQPLVAEPERPPLDAQLTTSSVNATSSPIRIKEFVMKNGNYTPVYDPDDLKRYQQERGLPEPRVYIPLPDEGAGSPETIKGGASAESKVEGGSGEPVYATIAPTPAAAAPATPAEESNPANPYIDAASTGSAPSHPKPRIQAAASSRDTRQTPTHQLPPRPPSSSQGSSHNDGVKYQREGGLWQRAPAPGSPVAPTARLATPEVPPEGLLTPPPKEDDGW